MKATLDFELPEDHVDLKIAIDSSRMYYLLCQISERIRNILKHEDISDETEKYLEELKLTIHENVNLDDYHG